MVNRFDHTRAISRNVRRRALLETLDCRRLLVATFHATDNADTIRITVASGVMSVDINGTVSTTTDADVQVFGKGGDDTFEFQGAAGRTLLLSGAAGNDSFRLAAGVALQNSKGTTHIDADDGIDSLVIDDTNPMFQGIDQYTFDAPGSGSLFYGFGTVSYGTELENFTLDENDLATTTQLLKKLPTLQLQINTRGGNDTVQAADGELDLGGFSIASTQLNGGLGTDSILFEDQSNVFTVGSTYTFGFSTFSGLHSGFTYQSFEDQTLFPSASTTIIINALRSEIATTTLSRSPAPGLEFDVNISLGGISNSGAVVTVDLPATTLTVNDPTATGTPTYQIAQSQLQKTNVSQVINYLEDASIVLNTSNLDDQIQIAGVAADTSVVVHAGGGADRLTLGNGNVDVDLLGQVTLDGGAGNNSLTVNNSADVLAENQALTGTAFVDGLTYAFSGLTSLTYNGGPGGTNLAINAVPIQSTLNGGAGDDTFNLFNGSLAANFAASLTIDGKGGADTMNLLGQNDGSSGRYDFPSSSQFRFGDVSTGKILTHSGIESASLQTGTAGDTLNVTSVPFPLRISTGTGNDVVNIGNLAQPVSLFPITVNTGPENGSFGGGDDLAIGLATVVIDQSDAVRNLSVGGTLRVASGAVLARVPPFLDFLPLNLIGTIDLAGGAMLWKAGGQTPDFASMVRSGHNGGAWNGVSPSGAINSSTASVSSLGDGVGYGIGSDIAPASLGGFTISAGDTLVRYTIESDANLDTNVNFDDLLIISQNYGQVGRHFSQGNVNYSADGLVGFDDLLLLAQRYGATLLQSPARTATSTRRRGNVID